MTSPTYVGRHAELDQFNEILAGVLSGRPAYVLVAREAGVGKSRLLAEWSRRARTLDARVLTLTRAMAIGLVDSPARAMGSLTVTAP